MAINKKFISFATQAQFDAKLAEIDDRSIVFIEDTKRIWTHGVFFDTPTSWNYVTDKPETFTPSAHTLGSHSDVAITSNSDGEILRWNGTNWINNTLAEAGIASTGQLNNYLPLVGGTLTGTITANNPITEAVIQKTSASGLAVLRMLSTGQSHDKGLGLSLSGDLIFGDWSSVNSLSSTWNKVWHSGNLANGTTSQYIRGDGSLATYSGTTYSEITEAQTISTSSSVVGLITGRRLKYAFDNITAANATNANILNRRGDNRGGFKPSDITSGALITTFSTQGALLSQTNNSDYVDVIGLSTYQDSSAGQVNVLAFDKSSHRITHFMGTFGTSSWSSNKTLAYTDGTGASGTWGISITGNAATATTASTATKVSNNLILKFDSGTTENTNLYTFNGSSGKTINIIAGSNISMSKAANSITINATNTTYSAGTKALALAGTDTTNRVWSGKTLKDWYLEEVDILLNSDGFTGSTFSSNVIDLTNVNGAFNVNSVNNYTTYTLSNKKVKGAWAKVLVNSSIPITITGVKPINLGSNFELNTNMYLNVIYDGINTLGYYTKVAGTITPSYYINTSSAVKMFTNTNTPIDNFSTGTSSMRIEGVNVPKNTIKDIYFYDDYSGTTSIKSNFLANCTSLTSVDLSGMVNLTSIGSSFLSVTGVKTLKMGAIVPPSFSGSLPSALTSILVPSAAVNAYKSATYWSGKASIISGY